MSWVSCASSAIDGISHVLGYRPQWLGHWIGFFKGRHSDRQPFNLSVYLFVYLGTIIKE